MIALLGRRLAPQWRCILWFLVFLRLIWPFHIASPVSLFEASDSLRDWWRSWDRPEFGRASVLSLFSLWCLVAGAFAIRLVAVNIWNLWRLRSARPLTSWDAWWLFQQAKESYGLRVPIAVLESPVVSSPCVVGFFRPRIVIPKNMLKDLTMEEVRLVFAHELAHLRRGDLWMGWIFEGLRTLHWFNPAVWYACRRFHEDREEACDAAALSVNPGANHTYGKLLLRFLSGTPNGAALLNAPSLTDGDATAPELMIRRIRAIARFRPGGHAWLAGLFCTLVIGLVGFTDPQDVPTPSAGLPQVMSGAGCPMNCPAAGGPHYHASILVCAPSADAE